MTAPVPETILQCTQCGGELHPGPGEIFLTCPFCAATVYLDASRVVFHWYVAPTLDAQAARGVLARWMAGDTTVKDLDRKASVDAQSFQYFPLWYFKYRDPAGADKVLIEPAAATATGELRALSLPGGDLKQYTATLDARATRPSVPLQTALNWAAEHGMPAAGVLESALVHVPLYTFKYTYQAQPYTAIVEVATGQTLASLYPAKAEAPYRAVGLATGAIFLAIALCGLLLTVLTKQNTLIGLGVCALVGALVAPLLFAAAARVATTV